MPSRPWRIERQSQDQLSLWRIHNGHAELRVAEQGAQLLSYQRKNEPPLIWLSEEAAYQTGQSVRGGAPICWPWFGDLTRNPAAVQAMHLQPASAPFHGLVRALPWQLEDISGVDEDIKLGFSLAASSLADWPHAVTPRLDITLGERLTLSLSSHNHGALPVALSQALHSYLAVSDIRQVSVHGLEDCPYLDTLEGWDLRQQQGPLRFSGETDRIYQKIPAQLRVHDPLWKRQICLASSGSHSAIVWNPWIDKAQRLSQFAKDAWQRMLCIETANVMDDAISLPAHAQHQLSLSLWTEPLA